MAKKTKTETPEPQPQPTGEQRPTTYVVVRAGVRVSDAEYSSPHDLAAVAECEFWTKVATDHSYGEPVDIVPYDPKKHRVW